MINIDRKRYDVDIQCWALAVIDRLRPVVFLGPRQLAGRRFNDTQRVLEVLESLTEQSAFETYPLVSIEKALQESANSDYWYEKEKPYDSELESESFEEDIYNYDD